MQTAFITGATAGIGQATAHRLAKEGYRIIACGRRQDRLDQLKQALQDITPVHTLNFDVRHKDQVQAAVESLPAEWQDIDVLVNNAGNAHGLSTMAEGNLDDWDAMIDINVKGLLYISRALIPGMVKRQKGHIVNIGSIAGKEVYPNGNVYNASKFAVDALNKAMRIDLHTHGIRVSAVHPGLVETEFSLVRFKGNEERAKQVYQGYTPLTAQDVADTIQFIISRPAHVNLADVLLLPSDQAASTIVNKRVQE